MKYIKFVNTKNGLTLSTMLGSAFLEHYNKDLSAFCESYRQGLYDRNLQL